MIVVTPHRERYREVIDVSQEGIIFKDIRRRTLYKWEKITHIFPWTRFNVLTVIDEEGNTSTGNVFPDSSFRRSSEKVMHIWNTWRDRIIDAQNIVRFEYSQWCRQKELRLTLQNAILGIGVGCCSLGLGIYIFMTEDWRTWVEFESYFVPIGGVAFGLCALWFGMRYLFERLKKKITTLSLDGDNLCIDYNNGSSDTLNIRNIKRFRLENPRNIGTLIFKNGKKLQHLERVSYWPILREYLLTKIGTSQKDNATK